MRDGDTIASAKAALVKEVNVQANMNLDPEKFRLRKKSWKNPQAVYMDHMVLGEEVQLYNNWEMCVQVSGVRCKTKVKGFKRDHKLKTTFESPLQVWSTAVLVYTHVSQFCVEMCLCLWSAIIQDVLECCISLESILRIGSKSLFGIQSVSNTA